MNVLVGIESSYCLFGMIFRSSPCSWAEEGRFEVDDWEGVSYTPRDPRWAFLDVRVREVRRELFRPGSWDIRTEEAGC